MVKKRKKRGHEKRSSAIPCRRVSKLRNPWNLSTYSVSGNDRMSFAADVQFEKPTVLQGQIVVLPGRHFHLLVLEHRQRTRDAATRRVRHDNVVDITAFCRCERREEAIFIFL